MNRIRLAPRNLLGFKIVVTDGATVPLRSPKIGGKQCQVRDEDAMIAPKSPTAATIGVKTD